MAVGKPVGTMYVELAMDATKYTKAQKDILAGAEQNSADINKVFKTVGTQSDAMYNAMRKNIENALGAIKQSHLSSADEIRRAQESSAQKIKAIDDAQFGAKKSNLDMIKGHYLAITAAVAVSIGAITKAWSMAKVGAEYDEQSGILDNLSRKYGTTADAIVAEMDRASDYQIKKSELMSIALGGIAKGLNPKQLTDLADAALLLGDAAGMSAAEALKSLTSAMETGRTKGVLPMLGTSLDLEKAFGDLAATMTLAEKAQGIYGLAMIKNAELQAQQTTAVDKGSDSIAQVEKKFDDATLAASRFAKTITVGLIDGFKATFLSGNDAGETLTNFGTAASAAATATTKEADAIKATIAPYQAQINALKKTLAARKDNEKAIKDGAADAKKAAEKAEKLLDDQYKHEMEILKATAKAEDDMRDDGVKGAKESAAKINKILDDEFKDKMKIIQDTEKAEADLMKDIEDGVKTTMASIKREEDTRLTHSRTLYQDLKGYENEANTASVALIMQQAADYKATLITKATSAEDAAKIEIAIAARTTNELELLNIKNLKNSKNFTDGVNAGYLEMERNAMAFGKAGYEIFNTFAGASKTALSTVLFDSIKTGTFDAQAVWTSFTDTMLKKFTDTVAQMVVEAALNDIAMMFKASWTADSSDILSIIKMGKDLWDLAKGGGGPSNIDIGGGDIGYGIEGRAGGGPVDDSPVWVGEKGRELLFPGGPGYVMEHGESMAYAARNGGYIPGFADGGYLDAYQNEIRHAGKYTPELEAATQAYMETLDYQKRVAEAQQRYNMDMISQGIMGWGDNGEPPPIGLNDPMSAYAVNPYVVGSWWEGNRQRIVYRNGTSTLNEPYEESPGMLKAMAAHRLITVAVMAALTAGAASSFATPAVAASTAAEVGAAATGAAAIPAVSAGWAGAGVGAGMGGMTGYITSRGNLQTAALSAILGGIGGYNAKAIGDVVVWAKNFGTEFTKKWAINQALKYVASTLFGGSGGSASYSFEGAEGDLAWLADSMKGIAPRSDRFSFPSYERGIDYVPRTGPAIIHEGENIRSKKDAQQSRDGGEIIIHNHLYIGDKEVSESVVRALRNGDDDLVKYIRQRAN